MKFVELKKHLASGKPRACYACYGDDEYIISRAIELICSLAGGIREFNISDKTFDKTSDVTAELMQLPAGGDFRIVISRGKLDNAELEKYLQNPNPSSVLVTVNYIPHDSWNHSSVVSFPVGAEPLDCNRIPVEYVIPFVRKKTDATKSVISDAAVRLIYDRCGGYLSRIASEAEKLAMLRADGEITEYDITEHVKPDTEFVVYELGDSIIAKNSARALEIVNGMAKNNDLTAAFTLLYNRFKRTFAVAVDDDAQKALNITPYQLNKFRADAKKFSKAQLKAIVDMLADADSAYKSGKISQYDALVAFTVRAAGQ